MIILNVYASHYKMYLSFFFWAFYLRIILPPCFFAMEVLHDVRLNDLDQEEIIVYKKINLFILKD